MKILVDEMPKSPKDCFFSEHRVVGPHTIYACTLRPYIEAAGCKPRCRCKSVDTCDRLQPMKKPKE